MTTLNTQSDLHWSLEAFDQPKKASDFFERFNGAIGIYSASVRKIYTDYEASITDEEKSVLVIQPDFYQFSSMFHHIPTEAIQRTSVMLYEVNDRIKLSAVVDHPESRQNFELEDGLYRLFDGQFTDGAFMPILTYGDLRSLPNQGIPVLQLHRLDVAQLCNLSDFQIKDVVSTLQQNLQERLQQA